MLSSVALCAYKVYVLVFPGEGAGGGRGRGGTLGEWVGVKWGG